MRYNSSFKNYSISGFDIDEEKSALFHGVYAKWLIKKKSINMKKLIIIKNGNISININLTFIQN